MSALDWQAEQARMATREMAQRIYEQAMAKYIGEWYDTQFAEDIYDAAWKAAELWAWREERAGDAQATD